MSHGTSTTFCACRHESGRSSQALAHRLARVLRGQTSLSLNGKLGVWIFFDPETGNTLF